MLAHLADTAIRSLLLALAAGMVVWMLRSRRTAALHHAVWTTVMCGMLALFTFGRILPRLPLRILTSPAAAPLQSASAGWEAPPVPGTGATRHRPQWGCRHARARQNLEGRSRRARPLSARR